MHIIFNDSIEYLIVIAIVNKIYVKVISVVIFGKSLVYVIVAVDVAYHWQLTSERFDDMWIDRNDKPSDKLNPQIVVPLFLPFHN